jgi:phenylalanyl-tRNA synthetase beta chain
MPSVKLNRKTFERLVGKKLSLDKMKDRISMIGTDLEDITDDEIHVEIFPNRPDMLSEQGFARAFSTFIGVKKGLFDFKVEPSGEKVIIDESLKDVRPYTACALVKNLKLDDEKIQELIQIQEKLHVTYGRNRKKVAIGIYPLDKIQLPITFTARKPENIVFHPLEGTREMDANDILEEHSTGKKYGKLLDGKKKYPIFVDSNNKILSMPPIINSHDVGKIELDTKEVFVECSGFDFDVLHLALNMIVTAMFDMGAKIYSMKLEYPDKNRVTPDLKPKKMSIDLKYVNKILGLELTEKDLKECLEKMGFGYENRNVLIPAYRADILHQVDFIEDIAIAYGYENFEEIIPNVSTIGQRDDFESFKDKICNILVGLGMLETSTYCITNHEHQTSMILNENEEVIRLANSVSEEFDSLRVSMVPSLLDVLKSNKHQEYPQNLFEASWTFNKDDSFETNIREDNKLGVVLCGNDVDYTKIRQVLDLILEYLKLKSNFKTGNSQVYMKGRCGKVSVNKEEVCILGEINPQVLENYELDMPVCALEFNLSRLYKIFNE